MKFYSEAAMERAMKIQEVILRAIGKRINWWQAAEIIGISDRQMRRWRSRYEQYGYDGLFDRRRGKPSPRRVPLGTVEKVLGLYQEKYFDFNVRHFHEKLREEHGLRLSYTWVKLALQGAGLVNRRRKRGLHRQRRPRRPLPGMLLHLDGSQHRWFVDDRWYDLLVVLDDASSEIYYAQLVEQESTRTVLAALREVVEQQGIFCALYSDRASHFFLTRKAGRAGGSATADPGGPRPAGAGHSDDSGLFAAGAGTQRAELRDLARAAAAGTAPAGNHHARGSESVPAGGLYRGVQPALCRAGHPTRQRLFAVSQAGVRPNLLDPAPADSESGQYGQSGEPPPPDRENSLARDSVGLPGDRL